MILTVWLVFFGFIGVFFNLILIYKFAFEQKSMFESIKARGLFTFKIIILGLLVFSVTEFLNLLSSQNIIHEDIGALQTILANLLILTLGFLSSYYFHNVRGANI